MNETPPSDNALLWLVVLIPIFFAIVFPLFWCFVVWLIAQIGGWSRFATRYRTDRKPGGTISQGVFGQFGLASYRGVLTCAANEEGLHLQPNVLFRVGHPPLFIPWSEFHDVIRVDYLWLRVVKARIGDPSVGTLRLEARAFENPPGSRILPTS